MFEPSLPGTTAEDPALGEACECPFCYRSYQLDGEEWLMCACGRWVHEQCMEEVFLDIDGEERFCPFCLN